MVRTRPNRLRLAAGRERRRDELSAPQKGSTSSGIVVPETLKLSERILWVALRSLPNFSPVGAEADVVAGTTVTRMKRLNIAG